MVTNPQAIGTLGYLMLGTAGHVDHGKTSLVRRLTGIDTDRLPEEKRRGISIELGFAWMDLPSGRRVGVIDVPGHERFVRTMAAGCSGVNTVLFVVSLTQGICAQTREHLAIGEMLGIDQGVVVLTKRDAVDEAQNEEMTRHVRELIAPTGLRDASICSISTKTGAGIEALIQAIDRLVPRSTGRTPDGHFRLWIDRTFTLKGIGRIAAGTVFTGEVAVGDELERLPEQQSCRVKMIECHGQPTAKASAGQRAALNLLGAEEVARGMMLSAPGKTAMSSVVDIALIFSQLLGQELDAFSKKLNVEALVGTGSVSGRLTVSKQSPEFGQLHMSRPIPIAPGMRLIIRRLSPPATICGGWILDSLAPKVKRLDERFRAGCRQLAAGDAEQIGQVIERAGLKGVTAAEIMTRVPIDQRSLSKILEIEITNKTSRKGNDQQYVRREHLASIQHMLITVVENYHREFSHRPGISIGELRSKIGQIVAVFQLALQELLEQRRLKQIANGLIADAAFIPGISSSDESLANWIDRCLAKTHYAPPLVNEWRQHVNQEMGEDAGSHRFQRLIEYRVRLGAWHRIAANVIYPRKTVDEVIGVVTHYLLKHETMSVGDFKRLLQISRKHAIPLLEYLDQRGITVRRGGSRLLGRKAKGNAHERSI